MKKSIFQEIEIPEGVNAEVNDGHIKVSGSEGTLERRFKLGVIEMKKEGNKIVIGNAKATKKEKKMINTISALLRNMVKGVQKKFEYELKICYSHFPITVEVKGHEALIKNFLGEKIARKAKIPEGVDIDAGKEIIKISSADKELAGRTAANFELATKVGKRDRRVFQDGIFMINKAGKEI